MAVPRKKVSVSFRAYKLDKENKNYVVCSHVSAGLKDGIRVNDKDTFFPQNQKVCYLCFKKISK